MSFGFPRSYHRKKSYNPLPYPVFQLRRFSLSCINYCVKQIKQNLQCSTVYFFRLSYHQRIKDMMPEAYARLIPPVPGPDYKYMHEGAGKSLQNSIFIF